jgi:uncharacterized protein (UPF0264 family)
MNAGRFDRTCVAIYNRRSIDLLGGPTDAMRLLVSVSSAQEAVAALEGGADVIDAKDPMRGALGAVRLETLTEIRAAIPAHGLVTAALGDAVAEVSIERRAHEYAARGAGLVKVGFAGINDVGLVERLLASCVRGCDRADATAGVIAVAYADASRGTAIDAMSLVAIAARAGARGVLVDTADKTGPGLTALWSWDELAAWIADVHECDLLAAVAGKLVEDDLAFVSDAGADVAGVRGAACTGGRDGRVSSRLVHELRLACKTARPD